MVPHQPVLLHSPIGRQGSLKEKRSSTTTTSTIEEQTKKKTTKKSKPKAIKEDYTDGNNVALNRSNSRKSSKPWKTKIINKIKNKRIKLLWSNNIMK